MNQRLIGEKALVTARDKGIGRAIALKLVYWMNL